MRFLGMGSFEELQCSGVLHHLKRPSYGLNILKDSLTESGGMALMVYGKYGRTSVYQTQDLLKIINSYQKDIEIELQNSIHILKIYEGTPFRLHLFISCLQRIIPQP